MCMGRTMAVADPPRVGCPEYRVRTISIPWAESEARITVESASLVVYWLHVSSKSAVFRLTGVSWNAVDTIMQRAAESVLVKRREQQGVGHFSVDENSLHKRYDYVTIVSDTKSGTVLHVGQDRKKEALRGWYAGRTSEQLEGIKSVSIDMWPVYINASLEHVQRTQQKVDCDRFHVA